jgi:hypothetical protein
LILFGQSSWWLEITHPVEINYTGDALPPSTSGWVPVHPHPWLPWCRVLILAVVAAAAVSFCARCWKTAVVLVAVAGTAALGLHLAQKGSAAISAVNASEMRCTGRAAALCLPKENEGARRRLQTQMDRLAGKLRGVRSAPSYYVVSDQSYRYRDWRADGAPAGSSPRVIGIELFADARSVTRDIACSDLCTGLLEGAVYTWLTGTPPDNLLFTEEQLHLVQVLDSLPSKQRANWLDRYLEAVWSGESLPDMPNTPRWSS